MATRSTISIIDPKSGSVTGIYCHWDGYPEGVGKTLLKHYSKEENVRALIALGAISVLCESIECPAGHSFDNPSQGCTVAYHRDRGEDFFQCKAPTANAFMKKYSEEFNYFFFENRWYLHVNGSLKALDAMLT